ncbi:lectin-like domain-containing protein [Latilactobacillus sp. 5-91]|uniref:lectin-like domain-containing protein n=1 Tax=Latilactobacillus sp. 5-91 TaxID=3410924 RepID=UPI003C78B153
MRKDIFITTIIILFIVFGNVTSVIAAVANSDNLRTDQQLSVLVDDKKTTDKQIFVAINDTSNQERELTMKIPDGLIFDEAATTNENKTNQTDISVNRSTSIIKIKFKTSQPPKNSQLVFSIVDTVKAQKGTFSVQSRYKNITYTSEEVGIVLPKESSTVEGSQSFESSNNQNSSEFSRKILSQEESNLMVKETRENSRASSEYLPVPDDTVPMSGVLTQKVGSSPIYDSQNNVLQITNKTGQVGGIWSKKKLNFSKDFVYDSYIYLGNQTSNAADGITFTFQNDPRMATTPSKVIAGGGFALGVYGNSSNTRNGYVKNALSIEFDTYMNTGSRDPIDKEVNSNGGRGHIAVVIPKAKNNTASGNHINPQYPTDYLSNGKWRRFKVAWNADNKIMTYGLEGLADQTYHFEPIEVFGANEAYWGFTGSTGNRSALNAVAISEIPQKGSQLLKIKDERTQEVITDLGQVQPGDSLEYELDTKYIDGPEDWANIFIKLSLPAGITYTPGSTTSDDKIVNDGGNISGQSLNIPIGDLKTDQVNKLIFKAKVNNNVADQTNLLNRGLAYNTDFGVQSNLVTLQVNKPKDPVLIKQVRNVSKGEKEFKDETYAYKDDQLEYQVITKLNDSKSLKDGVFQDIIDKNLTVTNQQVGMQIMNSDGTWGGTQLIKINSDDGKIIVGREIDAGATIKFTFKVIVNDDNKSEIDNTFSLIGGSYNGPWHSNVAKVNVIKKTPPTLIKEVKNITKSDADYMTETTAEVDDEIEYRIQLVNTASGDIKPGAILKDVFDADLGDIQQVKIDYLDQNEKITATQTTDWTNNQVILDHGIPVAGQGMAIAYVKAKVKETNKSVINNSASLATDFGTGTSEKAKLNIKQSKGRIVVRYRDRKDENHKLAEDKIYDGKIGDSEKIQPKVIPDSQGNWTVVDSSNQPNPDWGSTTRPDWDLAHDYTVTYAKDEQVITYRYEESHIGIIADKRWDFGKHDTTGTDRNYYLKAKTKDNQKQPYAVGVEDYYTSKGWTLNVKQDNQFHTNANEKIAGDQKFLDNAVLNFHNGHIALKESDDVGATAPVSKLTSEFELIPKGEAVNLMTHTNKTPDPGYYAAHGFGIWEYQFGDSKQADYSIGLRVPQTTKRYPRQYTSQLTWSLVIAE